MKKRLTIMFVVGVGAAGIVTLAGANPFSPADDHKQAATTKTCPPGQVLVGGNAGWLKFSHEKQLPHGYHFEDSESGSGPDFTVTSNRNSATVDADVPLTIVCE